MISLALAVTLTLAAPAQEKLDEKAAAKGQEAAKKIRKLQIERRDLLKKALTLATRRVEDGVGSHDSVAKASKELLKAELDLALTLKERLAAHEAHLEVMKKHEKLVEAAYKIGGILMLDLVQAQADRLEAEIAWLKAGGEEKKKDRKDK